MTKELLYCDMCGGTQITQIGYITVQRNQKDIVMPNLDEVVWDDSFWCETCETECNPENK